MSETYKKTIDERCPTCNQWTKKEIDVPVPKDGIECLIAENKDRSVDLTISLVRPIKEENTGRVDVYDGLSRSASYKIIELYAIKHLKDNHNLSVHEHNKDKYQIHDRRHVLKTGNVSNGLKSLKKASSQSRRNRQIDG